MGNASASFSAPLSPIPLSTTSSMARRGHLADASTTAPRRRRRQRPCHLNSDPVVQHIHLGEARPIDRRQRCRPHSPNTNAPQVISRARLGQLDVGIATVPSAMIMLFLTSSWVRLPRPIGSPWTLAMDSPRSTHHIQLRKARLVGLRQRCHPLSPDR